MSDIVIKAENISKQYRLGQVSAGTMANDFKRWAYKIRGKEDPFLKVGETNDRSTKGSSDYVWALRDINFEVKQGEVLGIIGKNGAGKSTLLKLLSRVTTPTTGSIKVRGRMASLLEVGTGFHPELTGRENVFLNGAIMGMSKAEIKAKFDEIVDFAGVERYIDTPVKRYSSGMHVRLGFAVAAHLEPEILVVDEVLAVGDAEFQKKCLGKMKSVSGEGRTVLFVSHNMGAIQTLCTKAIYLKNGLLHSSGATERMISEYLTNEVTLRGELDFNLKEALPVQMIRVRMLDESNSPNSQFKCGEKFRVEVLIESRENAGNVVLGIGIADSMDLNIYSDKSESFSIGNKTQRLAYTNKDTILAPGKYALTLNLFFNGKSVDYKEKVLTFEVSEITTNGIIYNLKTGEGAVVTHGNFNVV
ncbi:MAG: ABC transporter ATP-binding protein [Bacteroidia bacterium]|nr:ABC transporter ATP-binding protein [Bacteroidia bacterium]